MTNLEMEIESAINFLNNFDHNRVRNFLSKIKFPVLVGAMGSSYYLPSGRAQSLMSNIQTSSKIRFIFASEGYAIEKNNFESLFLISNSGKTREVVSLAKTFSSEKVFAVTSDKNSDLAHIAKNIYELKSGKEKAVAATKSIIEQSIICESLVRFIEGKKIPEKKELLKVAQAMRKNKDIEVDNKLLILISGARTVYFAGGSNGIGEEIALKFSELGKKKSKFIAGTQILHGTEEVIEKGDIVFLLFADKYIDYMDRFEQMKQKTGCHFVAVGEKCKFADFNLQINFVTGYRPYCILAYFWNILTRFALIKGYSLDKAEKISKVGVSI
jgi:fructoselysine-6-P-deglycase FrlB-like protein